VKTRVARILVTLVSIVAVVHLWPDNVRAVGQRSESWFTERAVYQTSFKSFGTMVVNDALGTIYVSFPNEGVVVALSFAGVERARASGLSQPEGLALSGGRLFAVLSGTGELAELDPITLARTSRATGLIGIRSIAETNGKLYVVTDANLYAFSPTTNTIATVSSSSSPASPVLSGVTMKTSSRIPGVIFSTFAGRSSGGPTMRSTVSPGGYGSIDGDYERFDFDDSGRIIAVEMYAPVVSRVDSFTGVPYGAKFDNPFLPADTGVAMSGTTAVLVGSGHQIYWYSALNPGAPRLSSDIGVQYVGAVADSPVFDQYGSRFVLAAKLGNGNLDILVLSKPTTPAVSTPPNPTTRSAATASASSGVPGGSSARQAATQARLPLSPPLALKSFGDIQFDVARNRVYVSDPKGHALSAYDLNGNAVTTATDVAGVNGLAILNGSLYASLASAGSVVRFDRDLTTRQEIAVDLGTPTNLVATNGLLWTETGGFSGRRIAEINPMTGLKATHCMVTLGGGSGISSEPVNGRILFRTENNGHAIFDPFTRTPACGATSNDWNAGATDREVVDVPGTHKAVGSDGYQYDTTNPGFVLDPIRYGSYGRIAAADDGSTLVFCGVTNSGTLAPQFTLAFVALGAPSVSLASFRMPVGMDLLRLVFQPGTRRLWAVVNDSQLGVRVSPVFDVSTGTPLNGFSNS
jgi:hypothetical protein